jgi:hypothetical protein
MSGKSTEDIEKLKASTYNLVDGKVVETKLEVKGNVLEDKIHKNLKMKKFTLPNVKEGSIIEFEYTKTSDFLSNLEPWAFQSGYPIVWSEYTVEIPEFFGYLFLAQGDTKFDVEETKSSRTRFNITDPSGYSNQNFTLDANVKTTRWVKKNVKPLKSEGFTTTIANYISKIEFQLQELRDPLQYKSLMGNWLKLTTALIENEYFGATIAKGKVGWLGEIVNPLTANASTQYQKAYNIYNYVRDNFTCTDYSDMYIDKSLKDVVKNKKGTVAELNLLLTAMLRYANIESDPVILSTRSNGKINTTYPIMNKFNYVVTSASLDGQDYYLDASEPMLGFGRLPVRCYNGPARLISANPQQLEINSNYLMEASSSLVFITNEDNGSLSGNIKYQPGQNESHSIRKFIKDKGKDELKKEMKSKIGDVEVEEITIDSLENYENRLALNIDFKYDDLSDDIIYFNPMLNQKMTDNPFKSSERFYPIEMPYTMDNFYQLQMDIPNGYVVDELPQSVILKLNDQGEGFFEYRISQSGNKITFRSRIRFTRANYDAGEYQMLREFFAQIVKKHEEQIVFKKSK